MSAAPRSVNYSDTLPLAISSTQNRRSYYPQNGQSFNQSSNIIRIDVNADGLLDTQQSYLEFTLTNTSGAIRAMDQGHAWIKRLTIESAGVVLEDINNYNRLVAGILQPAQGSAAYTGEVQVAQYGGSNQTGKEATAAAAAIPDTAFRNANPIVEIDQSGTMTPVAVQSAENATGVIDTAGSFTGQYHLVCGLLNLDKYLPLVLMGQGFTIQLELETGDAIGITTAAAAATPQTYTISNVKYVAHIVEMQRDFYDMLRNLQAASGGSIMLGGSTFRHFSHAYTPTAAGTESINISARVRSLENLLFVGNDTANLASNQAYGLSGGTTLGAKAGSFNVFIGSVRYPSNQIKFNAANNKGEAYQELRKCFGALGSINHGGLLNSASYLSSDHGDELDGGIPGYAPFGISFKSWRHELEDGIDTSSRALPIRLDLRTDDNASPAATTLDIYAQATILFYVNMDGSVSSSV